MNEIGFISVVYSEATLRIIVQFTFTPAEEKCTNVGGLHEQMTGIVCRLKNQVPDGWSLMLGGKLPNGITIVTAVLTPEQIGLVGCEGGGFDWTQASHYSRASALKLI